MTTENTDGKTENAFSIFDEAMVQQIRDLEEQLEEANSRNEKLENALDDVYSTYRHFADSAEGNDAKAAHELLEELLYDLWWLLDPAAEDMRVEAAREDDDEEQEISEELVR